VKLFAQFTENKISEWVVANIRLYLFAELGISWQYLLQLTQYLLRTTGEVVPVMHGDVAKRLLNLSRKPL